MIFASKFITGLILGAAAGAAIGTLLQTEKGKEILDDIKDAAGSTRDNIKSNWENFEKDLNDLIKKGKQLVDDLEKKAKNASSVFK